VIKMVGGGMGDKSDKDGGGGMGESRNKSLSLLQGAKKLCPQCNMITSPSDLRRIYM